MIFVAEDVGEHLEAVAFLHQAHRHAGDGALDRHARVHQREAGAAHARHRARAVRLENFRDDADDVREGRHVRHHGGDAATREVAVADFAALRRAHHAGLADAERREVVVKHERLFALAGQRIDDLRVAAGAERGDDQRLRLAAREQRRAVRTRQHAGADRDRAHRLRVAAVDARLAGEDAADARCDIRGWRIPSTRSSASNCGASPPASASTRGFLDLLDAVAALQLVGDLVGVGERGFRVRRERGFQLRVGSRRAAQVQADLPASALELVDRLDRRPASARDRTSRRRASRLRTGCRLATRPSARLRAVPATTSSSFDVLQLRGRGIEHVLAVLVADLRGADRAAERHAGRAPAPPRRRAAPGCRNRRRGSARRRSRRPALR